MMRIVLFVLILLAGAAFLLRTPEGDADALKAKYTNAASKFVASDDGHMQIHYRDEGARFGVPIVLIHGSSSSLHDWEPLLPHLRDEYRVITLTLPGHGLTGPHPDDDYSYAAMADALDTVIHELELSAFVLGGSSMGGLVAWRYTLANPERIRALILFNAAGMPLREGEKAPPLNIGFQLVQNGLGRALMQQYTPRFIVKQSVEQTIADPALASDELVDRYWELLRYPGNRRASTFRFSNPWAQNYASLLNSISAPTLIVWGKEDQLIYPSAAQTFDENLPNGDVIVYDNVGHLPMLETPARAALDIDAYLERTLKSPLAEN